MKIVNPFGKSVNDVQPMAGCVCSSGKSNTDSTYPLCLGYCGCQCGCPNKNDSVNSSSNYSKGANTHMM